MYKKLIWTVLEVGLITIGTAEFVHSAFYIIFRQASQTGTGAAMIVLGLLIGKKYREFNT